MLKPWFAFKVYPSPPPLPHKLIFGLNQRLFCTYKPELWEVFYMGVNT